LTLKDFGLIFNAYMRFEEEMLNVDLEEIGTKIDETVQK